MQPVSIPKHFKRQNHVILSTKLLAVDKHHTMLGPLWVRSSHCALLADRYVPTADMATNQPKIRQLFSLNSGNSEDIWVGTKNMRMGLICGKLIEAFK